MPMHDVELIKAKRISVQPTTCRTWPKLQCSSMGKVFVVHHQPPVNVIATALSLEMILNLEQ